jgi:hypothetical protein
MRITKILAVIVGLYAFGQVASAQTAWDATTKAAQAAASQSAKWISVQWGKVQAHGKPMADRIVREFPAQFKNIPAQVTHLAELTAQISDPTRLGEKQRLLAELWRVRGSLNLLALCSPELVQQVSGLDMRQVAFLQSQVMALRSKLTG